jgi:hypothetical protein
MARRTFSASHSTFLSYGAWTQTTRRYLGLKFIIQGQVHYGWARLNVTATIKGIYGAISEYAYETVPNKPIRTGQTGGAAKKKHNAKLGPVPLDAPAPMPGDLGSLAAGAAGLALRRAEDASRK